MLKQQFLKTENINMMWEVMSEETIIQHHNNKDLIINIFISNCAVFFNQEMQRNPNISLMELNKKCILVFLDFMKTFGQQHNKINIHKDDEQNLSITIEDLKSQRQLEFNTKLNEMKTSFDELHAKPRPPTPIFEDAIKDVSLSASEMETNLQSVIQQRNYDIHEVKKTVQFVDTNEQIIARMEKRIDQLEESIKEILQIIKK